MNTDDMQKAAQCNIDIIYDEAARKVNLEKRGKLLKSASFVGNNFFRNGILLARSVLSNTSKRFVL